MEGDGAMPGRATPRRQRGMVVPHPQLRVTDADREQVVEHVKTAFVEGRLSKDEMDERLHRAMTARTHADLTPIWTDLYGSRPAYVPPPPMPQRPGYAGPSPEPADRVCAAVAHLMALAGLFVIGPLIMHLAVGRTSPYIRAHAVEALNFHLTVLGASIVLPFTVVGLFLLPVIWVAGIVCAIVAGVHALAGSDFRYPLTLRPVK